jgi:hypothetical protein
MNTNQAWRQMPISIEQWKANCAASSHVRAHETLSFNERQDVVTCFIEGTSIFLGSYFIKGDANANILPGTGWNHE